MQSNQLGRHFRLPQYIFPVWYWPSYYPWHGRPFPQYPYFWPWF